MMTAGKSGEMHYPNKIGSLLIMGIREILGAKNTSKILQIADLNSSIESYQENNLELQFSANQLSSILNAIEVQYGQHAGRGLALRAGRAWFKIMLREYGLDLGLANSEFRLLPLRNKLPVGASIFADAVNQLHSSQIQFEESRDSFLWHVNDCPVCQGRQSDTPTCHLWVGILQEGLYWLSGGKDYLVEETGCIATGADRCSFQILRQAVH
jgi:predicted hydrocarbon binding protein